MIALSKKEDRQLLHVIPTRADGKTNGAADSSVSKRIIRR